ncbi:MAG TPA: glycosyltransferase family 9 protein [Candidatus Ozemobacteraceae bacterium]|nr:glycosyltransferase family 9 protein [Candidatus Ozemobacteraceae bacterium]
MIEGKRRILVSRTDRVGDVVLTLPVFTALRKQAPQAHLIGHVRSYTAPLLDGHPHVDELLVDDPDGRPLAFLDLVRRIRALRPDAAVLVHPSGRAIAACWLARVPVTSGRASNVWQFLLTHRIVQHRSRNEKHEAAYNLDLLAPLGVDADRQELPSIYINDNAKSWATGRLAATGISTSPVFVHPGHGGSADNLPLERYVELVSRLTAAGLPVVITLGPAERHLEAAFGPIRPGVTAVIPDAPDIAHLAGLLSLGRGFAGGSTGPMHLAAVLGLTTVAFFPRRASMTPFRWGPLGLRTHVLMPPEEAGVTPDAMSKLDTGVAVGILCGHSSAVSVEPAA